MGVHALVIMARSRCHGGMAIKSASLLALSEKMRNLMSGIDAMTQESCLRHSMNPLATIANALHRFYAARDAFTAAKTDIIRLAISHGQLQQDALKGAQYYLDALMAANGQLTVQRKEDKS